MSLQKYELFRIGFQRFQRTTCKDEMKLERIEDFYTHFFHGKWHYYKYTISRSKIDNDLFGYAGTVIEGSSNSVIGHRKSISK